MTQDIRRSPLGGHAAALLSQLSAQGKTLFTHGEARSLTSLHPRHLDNLLQHLAKQKWLLRLSRGLYLILPLEAGPEAQYTEHEFLIATSLVKPSAIAYWSALNHHGFTEQIPRSVFVATTRRRFHSRQTILGIAYHFVTLAPHKFFGLMNGWIEGRSFQITDPEKTLADGLDQPQLSGSISEMAETLWIAHHRGDFDWEKFTGYAGRMANRAIFKRAGYLAELLNLPLPNLYSRWQKQLSQGYVRLEPTLPPGGQRQARWKVQHSIANKSRDAFTRHEPHSRQVGEHTGRRRDGTQSRGRRRSLGDDARRGRSDRSSPCRWS